MPERDDRYARPDLPSTTAEFRAAPDASASTAEFKAFAAGGSWPEQPWVGEQPRRGSRRTAIIVAAIIAIAVIVTLLVAFG